MLGDKLGAGDGKFVGRLQGSKWVRPLGESLREWQGDRVGCLDGDRNEQGFMDRTARSVACLKKGSKSVDSSQKDGGGSVSSGFIAFRVSFPQ